MRNFCKPFCGIVAAKPTLYSSTASLHLVAPVKDGETPNYVMGRKQQGYKIKSILAQNVPVKDINPAIPIL